MDRIDESARKFEWWRSLVHCNAVQYSKKGGPGCPPAYAASRASAHRCTVRHAASTWQPWVSVPPSAHRIT